MEICTQTHRGSFWGWNGLANDFCRNVARAGLTKDSGWGGVRMLVYHTLNKGEKKHSQDKKVNGKWYNTMWIG